MKKLMLLIWLIVIAAAVFGESQVPIEGVYEIRIFEGNNYQSDTDTFETISYLMRAQVDWRDMTMGVGIDLNGNRDIDDGEVKWLPMLFKDINDGHWAVAYGRGESVYFWYDTELKTYILSIYDNVRDEYNQVPMDFAWELK